MAKGNDVTATLEKRIEKAGTGCLIEGIGSMAVISAVRVYAPVDPRSKDTFIISIFIMISGLALIVYG